MAIGPLMLHSQEILHDILLFKSCILRDSFKQNFRAIMARSLNLCMSKLAPCPNRGDGPSSHYVPIKPAPDVC